jgi:hypothetical protein
VKSLKGRIRWVWLARMQRTFYSSADTKLAEQARDADDSDRIYITRVRVRRGNGRVILTWQVISVPGSDFRKLKELAEEERDDAIDVIADSLEEPLWGLLTDGWNPVDAGDFEALADRVSTLQEELKRYLVGDPAKFTGTALGLTDLSLLEAIAERVPLPVLDRSLGDIKHYAEIAGIILVVLTGGHILACASFKLWVHDKLGQYLAKLLNNFFRGLGAERVEHPSPADAADGRRSPPDDPHRPPPDTGSFRGGPDGPPDDDRDPPSPDWRGPFPGRSGGLPSRRPSPAGVGRPRPASPRQPAAGPAGGRQRDAREPREPAASGRRQPARVRVERVDPERSQPAGSRPESGQTRPGTSSRGPELPSRTDGRPAPVQPAPRNRREAGNGRKAAGTPSGRGLTRQPSAYGQQATDPTWPSRTRGQPSLGRPASGNQPVTGNRRENPAGRVRVAGKRVSFGRPASGSSPETRTPRETPARRVPGRSGSSRRAQNENSSRMNENRELDGLPDMVSRDDYSEQPPFAEPPVSRPPASDRSIPGRNSARGIEGRG